MRRITWCVGVLMLLVCGGTEAAQPAGTVLYFQSGGKVYLLLAEHAESTRGWAGFGGSGREGETVAETAARKTEEESRGYYKQADILQKIKGQSPVVDGDFSTYLVEVAFVPAQRVMNNPAPEDKEAYLERSTFAWIPYSVMEDFLKADLERTRKYMMDPLFLPAGSQTQWLWPAWLRTMRKAIVIGALPWQEK